MKRNALAFLSGLLFAVGLAVSGMTRPDRVIGFLDVSGRWDPTLAYVMAGALAVMFVAHRRARRLIRPAFGTSFPFPAPRELDARLIAGAAIFGVGWGVSGFCPGPGIVSIGAVTFPAIVFVSTMAAGIVVHDLVFLRSPPDREPATGDR